MIFNGVDNSFASRYYYYMAFRKNKLVSGKISSFVEVVGLEAIIVTSVIIGVVLILNYFSVIPLSEKFPGLLGWLPHQKASDIGQDAEKKAEVYTSFFECPVADNICTNALPVFDAQKDQFAGIGFITLREYTPVRAMLSGTITSTPKEDNLEVILTSDDNAFEITYLFPGEMTLDRNDPRRGEDFARIAAGSVTIPQTPQSYALFISIKDTTSGNNIQLIPDKEKKFTIY